MDLLRVVRYGSATKNRFPTPLEVRLLLAFFRSGNVARLKLETICAREGGNPHFPKFYMFLTGGSLTSVANPLEQLKFQ